MASAPPTAIRALTQAGELELDWGAGPRRVPFRLVRERCPCASCVDEITGQRILDPASVPADIRPAGMSFTGHYALQINWSDGHSTGLYTWDLLRELTSG